MVMHSGEYFCVNFCNFMCFLILIFYDLRNLGNFHSFGVDIIVLGSCQKLAGGRGGGNFKFGFGNEVIHPCKGSKFANPFLDLGLKYHDPPPLV